jgi:hypothetical protein
LRDLGVNLFGNLPVDAREDEIDTAEVNEGGDGPQRRPSNVASSSACRPRGREEEEDVLLLGGSRLAARYQIGIQAGPRMDWLAGPA